MPNTRKNPRDPDSPFLTKEFFKKAVPFKQRFPQMDTSTITAHPIASEHRRPASQKAAKTRTVSLTLSGDVADQLQATGPDWPTLAEHILRTGLKRRKSLAA